MGDQQKLKEHGNSSDDSGRRIQALTTLKQHSIINNQQPEGRQVKKDQKQQSFEMEATAGTLVIIVMGSISGVAEGKE